MNPRAVRTWLRHNTPLIDTVSAAIGVLGASCQVLAVLGPEEQITATPPMLTVAAIGIRDALDVLADAPRVPDLSLDLMMVGAIGRLRRCVNSVLAGHYDGACPGDCDGHVELDQWIDDVGKAMTRWATFKGQLSDF